MSTQKVKNKYNCKQTELYAVATSFITSLDEKLANFTALNTIYNPAYVAALQTLLNNARDLPNFQQRNEPSEILRIQIRQQADVNLDQWRALRSYIEHAFPPELVKPKLEAAGWSYFNEAGKYNWEEIDELIDSGREFILANEPALLAGGMPAAFPAEYETQQNVWRTFFNQLSDTQQDQKESTDAKIEANNTLYDRLIRIGRDASVIYRTNPTTRERFSFTAVLSLVSSSGPAKLKGKITDGANAPIEGVSVYLEEVDAETFTDADGNYDTGNIPSGTYKVKFTKAGFEAQEMEIVLGKGVTKTQNITLAAQQPQPLVREGMLMPGAIANIDFGEPNLQNATITLEAENAPMTFFASNMPSGMQTGMGNIAVNPGMPFSTTVAALVSQLGLFGANSYFNVQNTGGTSGTWRATLSN